MTSGLNRDYTFENFVRGAASHLALGSALAVAENPGGRLNPLYLYGPRAVGKTHLLHALGNVVEERGGQVAYVTGEHFTNGLLDAIGDASTRRFRERYRQVDLLLFDDVQFLIRKSRVEEDLLWLLYELRHRGRQIVVAADRPPGHLVTFLEQTRTFLKWGMVAELEVPDRATREEILRREGLPGPIAELLLDRLEPDVRSLRGGLTRVLGYCRLRELPLTVESALRALEC